MHRQGQRSEPSRSSEMLGSTRETRLQKQQQQLQKQQYTLTTEITTTTTTETAPHSVLTGSLESEGTKWHSLLSSHFHKHLIANTGRLTQRPSASSNLWVSLVLLVPSDLPPYLSFPVTLTHFSSLSTTHKSIPCTHLCLYSASNDISQSPMPSVL